MTISITQLIAHHPAQLAADTLAALAITEVFFLGPLRRLGRQQSRPGPR